MPQQQFLQRSDLQRLLLQQVLQVLQLLQLLLLLLLLLQYKKSREEDGDDAAFNSWRSRFE